MICYNSLMITLYCLLTGFGLLLSITRFPICSFLATSARTDANAGLRFRWAHPPKTAQFRGGNQCGGVDFRVFGSEHFMDLSIGDGHYLDLSPSR